MSGCKKTILSSTIHIKEEKASNIVPCVTKWGGGCLAMMMMMMMIMMMMTMRELLLLKALPDPRVIPCHLHTMRSKRIGG